MKGLSHLSYSNIRKIKKGKTKYVWLFKTSTQKLPWLCQNGPFCVVKHVKPNTSYWEVSSIPKILIRWPRSVKSVEIVQNTQGQTGTYFSGVYNFSSKTFSVLRSTIWYQVKLFEQLYLISNFPAIGLEEPVQIIKWFISQLGNSLYTEDI